VFIFLFEREQQNKKVTLDNRQKETLLHPTDEDSTRDIRLHFTNGAHLGISHTFGTGEYVSIFS